MSPFQGTYVHGNKNSLEVGSSKVVAVVWWRSRTRALLIFLLCHLQPLGFGFRLMTCNSCCSAPPPMITGRWSKQEGRAGAKGFTSWSSVLLIKWIPGFPLSFRWLRAGSCAQPRPIIAEGKWNYCSHLRWIMIYLLGLESNPPSKAQGISTP